MRLATLVAATLALFCTTASSCLAADTHAAPAPSHATTAHAPNVPHANQPVLPPAGVRWPAVMVMIVAGMFIAAVAIGAVVRMNMPEEAHDAHGHDDSHGHDHAHGQDHGHGGHH